MEKLTQIITKNTRFSGCSRVEYAISHGEEVRLRALGCPAELAKKIVAARRQKRNEQTERVFSAATQPTLGETTDFADEERRKRCKALGDVIAADKVREAQIKADENLKRRLRIIATVNFLSASNGENQ